MLKNIDFLKIFAHRSDQLPAPFIRKHLSRLFPVGCILILLCAAAAHVAANEENKNSADINLRSTGRVNPSTLGMEMDIPLGSYPGRGISLPIGLSYSSKLWRLKYLGEHPAPGGNWSSCKSNYTAKFSEDAASGWTTSLAAPYIDYAGAATQYDYTGKPYSGSAEQCVTSGGNDPPDRLYIRRILVRLPSGGTHELRAEDSAQSTDYNDQANWNGVYYAVDGSNLKYIQNSTAAPPVYRLQMPDGSFYDFDSTLQLQQRRLAVRYTDRNGNFTSYFGPGSVDENGVTHPNGYWKDTLGRIISVPIGLSAPSAPTPASNPQVYSLPGMTGSYKLHWKRLKGSTQAESALTDINDPNYQLRYTGDLYLCTINGVMQYCQHPAGTYLFNGGDSRIFAEDLFNPVVLAEIELPTGQKYKFTYDVYARIEKIIYPTGGVEVFEYGPVPPLTKTDVTDLNRKTNFGVRKRRLYETAGQTPYEWIYEAFYTEPYTYVVRATNPDGTKRERFLHRGQNGGSETVRFGYDYVLAGMPYEERLFDDSGRLVSRKKTFWTKSVYAVNPGGQLIAERQPRIAQEKTFIYNSSGDGVAATVVYDYDGDLNQPETPVLLKKTAQYAFEAASGGDSIAPASIHCLPDEQFCEPPPPLPPPLPLPPPSTPPVRITESTYLTNDPAYPDWVKNIYKDRNMIGLVTSTVVKDGAQTVMSRSETVFDEASSSPALGRGNPTASRVWDNTRGNYNEANAYITTYAKFDQWGNQYEATDANGVKTTTVFDPVHHAFPVQIITDAPDPTGQRGSNAPFVTAATFDYVTGLPLTNVDVNGLETRYEYDPVTLRITKTKYFYNNQQVGSETETVYHDQPHNYWIKTRTLLDVNKWHESITYLDGLGRAYKSEEINSEGDIFIEKEFDSEGRVKRVSNPFRNGEQKHWTTTIYDEASRVKEVIFPDGSKMRIDYGVLIGDLVGVTKQITDQAGKKRLGISDALDRMIRVTEDPGGQNLHTDYIFDALGNLRKTVQGGQSRYFSYDSLGRLLYAKQPEQDTNDDFDHTDAITGNSEWSVRYEYDAGGNLVKTTDARGVSITGTYDKLNRLIFRDYSDQTPDVSFFYDGTGLPTVPAHSKGKVTKVASSVSENRYTSFDVLGRLLSSEQRTPFSAGETPETAAPKVFTYQYNLAGDLIAETYPSGRTVFQDLDQNGRLESVRVQKPGGAPRFFLNQIKYNSAGAVERMRLGNGRWETAAYNPRGQIVELGLGFSAADRSLLKLTYSYGDATQNNGSLRQQKISYRELPGEIVQDYTYDDLNRLKSSTETVAGAAGPVWKQTFNYDRYGNRTFDAANTTTISQIVDWKITNPLISPENNRLQKDQDGDTIADYSYDKAGNLTIDAENRRFVYDADNRMREFFHSANTSDTPDAVYSYDGEGRRVKKRSGNRLTIFVYNGSGRLVAEYDTEPVENPRTSYLTTDHLGSPRVITGDSGEVVSRHDYTAFGSDITETLGLVGGRTAGHGYSAPDDVRKRFTGYERDDESGLDFAQARYYNSMHGRFTSVDPLTASADVRNPQTFNRYVYVLNSPYKFTDPLGLIASCCTQEEIDRRIEEDWAVIIDEQGNEYHISEESLEKIKEKLRPFYNKAARLGFDTQMQINDAARRPPIVAKIIIEEIKPGSVTQKTNTINGSLGKEVGTEVSGTIGLDLGTNNASAERSATASAETGAKGSLDMASSTTTTDSEVTTKTTIEIIPNNAVVKAADNAADAQKELSRLADQAAEAIKGMKLTGTLIKSNGTDVSASYVEKPIKMNGYQIRKDLARVFDDAAKVAP